MTKLITALWFAFCFGSVYPASNENIGSVEPSARPWCAAIGYHASEIINAIQRGTPFWAMKDQINADSRYSDARKKRIQDLVDSAFHARDTDKPPSVWYKEVVDACETMPDV